MSSAHARKRFQHAVGSRLPRIAFVPKIDPHISEKISPILRGVTASIVLGGISAVSWAVAPASAAPAAKAQANPVIKSSSVLADVQQQTANEVNPTAAPSPSATAVPAASPTAAAQSPQPSASTPQPAPTPAKPQPVGGLSQTEMDNAVAIVTAGKQMNLPRQAFVVAIATALQESHLRNLANPNVSGSMDHPNEGVGYDYDSVGLFQQRPNWGTVDQLMDPQESARRFYAALVQVSGWEQMAVTVAAQTVQGSAFPNAYAQWQSLAEQIVDAIG